MNCKSISVIVVLLCVTFNNVSSMSSSKTAEGWLRKEARNRQLILDAELPAKIHKKLLGWCRYAQFCRHQHPVVSVCCSPDGRCLFSGTSNRQGQMWEVPNRVSRDERSILSIEASSFHSFNALCCSPDGKYLFVGSSNATITVATFCPRVEVVAILKEHTGQVTSLCCSPDAGYLFSRSNDGTIKVWDLPLLPTTTQSKVTLQAQSRYGQSLCCSANGQFLFAGGLGGVINVWDVRGQCDAMSQPVVTLQGHTRSVEALCCSPDGRYLFSGSDDTTINVWDLQEELQAFTQPVATLKKHAERVTLLSCSFDGRYLFSASTSESGTIYVWDLQQGLQDDTSPVARIREGAIIKSLCCLPNGSLAVGVAGQVNFYIPCLSLDTDEIDGVLRWYKDRPTLDQLSREEFGVLLGLPRDVRPAWLEDEYCLRERRRRFEMESIDVFL